MLVGIFGVLKEPPSVKQRTVSHQTNFVIASSAKQSVKAKRTPSSVSYGKLNRLLRRARNDEVDLVEGGALASTDCFAELAMTKLAWLRAVHWLYKLLRRARNDEVGLVGAVR